ncbi:MAG TPA: complex I subunit 1 family protein [Acetobacteraceae bacterium]|nr:complex I subunit 1 family protein [Acetobacteraceae bacterium]
MTSLRIAFEVLVWPGLLGAAAFGFLYLWIARKLSARLQGRRGPPFYQPFFDFMKLLGKQTVVPRGANTSLFYALPFISVGATVFGLVIVPVPGNTAHSFPGDVVLLLYLLEMPVLCDVLAGYVSRSIYGQVSAMREAVMSLGYNLPFLAAVIAMAEQAGSFRLGDLQAMPFGPVTALAAIAFLLAIPARLKSNPFSIPNAEQEIGPGAHMEYNAVPLAMFELSHAMEVVLLFDAFFVIFCPSLHGVGAALAYVLAGMVLIVLVVLIAVTTARLTVTRAFRFYWVWGGVAACAAMVIAMIG